MLRRLDNVSQSDMAEWLGLTRNMISNIESGRVPLKLGTGWKAANILSIHPNFFLTGKQKAFPNLHPEMKKWLDGYCVLNTSTFGDAWPPLSFMTFQPLSEQRGLALQLSNAADLDTMQEGVKEFIFSKSVNSTQATLDTRCALPQSADVKEIRSLSELLNQLQKFTKDRGGKMALAKAMGVSRQAVDQWLSEATKPTAEMTFELIAWVKNQRERTK